MSSDWNKTILSVLEYKEGCELAGMIDFTFQYININIYVYTSQSAIVKVTKILNYCSKDGPPSVNVDCEIHKVVPEQSTKVFLTLQSSL